MNLKLRNKLNELVKAPRQKGYPLFFTTEPEE
jgi:hypothetical protein